MREDDPYANACPECRGVHRCASWCRQDERDDEPESEVNLMLTLCLEIPDREIKLEQRGPDRFRVTYSKQVEDNLTYDKAALELGAAIMHSLACDGLLDNSERKSGRAQ